MEKENRVTIESQLRPILYPIIATIVMNIFFIDIIIEAWYTEYRAFSVIVYLLLFGYILIIPIYIHIKGGDPALRGI